MDEIKSASIEKMEESLQQLSLDCKVKELKESGNAAFNKKNFKESIDFYTKAIDIPGVSNHELAVLFSNRSVAFLKQGNISSAEEDAKKSIELSTTWWKGYYRVAMVYKAKENYELAFKNLSLCQKYHDNPKNLESEINICKRLSGQQGKPEHFDPTYFFNIMKDMTKHIHNFDFTEMLEGFDDFGRRYCITSGINAEGYKYYIGDGYKQNYEEAAKFYGKSAKEGNSEAMYNLANMYMEGEGVKKDLKKCIKFLEEAAEQPNVIGLKTMTGDKGFLPTSGVGESQHALGVAYEKGIGVSIDYEKSRYWYNRAIKSWSGHSAINMANIYLKGVGVPASVELAIHYWKIGAGMDSIRCMEVLAHNYFALRKFEDMQKWYLYAMEHASGTLKFPVKFQEHFQDSIRKNFDAEAFSKALWREIESGPLKHLIDRDVKSARDTLKKYRGIPCHKIDASTADSYKKTITLAHRKGFQKYMLSKVKANTVNVFVSWGNKVGLKPKLTFNLLDLKPVSLEEMRKKNDDHIYQGYFLNGTIMEDPTDKVNESTAIHCIFRDKENLYQRLSVYNYSPNKTDLQKYLGFGSKITIINPYYRIGLDGSPLIRVDNFNSVFVDPKDKNEKICRYCGNENYERPPIQCRFCKRCYYCNKTCLKLDASELQHDLVCKTKI